MGGNIAGGAAGALTGSLLNGANIGQVAKSTFTGALWGAASGFLNFASGDGTILEQLFKHTFSQGCIEGVQGGNMLHGFMMGAASSVGGSIIDNNLESLGKAGEIAANSILSGTLEEIGGGKFANGAITGAFSILFNDMMHDDRQIIEIKVHRLSEIDKPLEPVYPEFYLLLFGKPVADEMIASLIDVYDLFSNYYIKETGGIKQWIRFGKSYSIKGKFYTDFSVRWGAPKHYRQRIGNNKLRQINKAIRKKKLPGNSWRVQDPGHLHIKRK